MATLTKKDLLEAIEDMPDETPIVIVAPNGESILAEKVRTSFKWKQIEIC